MELMVFLYALLLAIIVPFAIWVNTKSGERWLKKL